MQIYRIFPAWPQFLNAFLYMGLTGHPTIIAVEIGKIRRPVWWRLENHGSQPLVLRNAVMTSMLAAHRLRSIGLAASGKRTVPHKMESALTSQPNSSKNSSLSPTSLGYS